MTYRNHTSRIANMDPEEFNTKLARKLGQLKREVGATSIKQGYRGKGSKSAQRQVLVGGIRGTTDVWLREDHVVIAMNYDQAARFLLGRTKIKISHTRSDVQSVYDEIKQVFEEMVAAQAGKSASLLPGLIRLGNANPELRQDLKPVIAYLSRTASVDEDRMYVKRLMERVRAKERLGYDDYESGRETLNYMIANRREWVQLEFSSRFPKTVTVSAWFQDGTTGSRRIELTGDERADLKLLTKHVNTYMTLLQDVIDRAARRWNGR